MKTKQNAILNFVTLALMALPVVAWAQDDKDPAKTEGKDTDTKTAATVQSEVTVGLYYLDHDSYRYGKFSGLTDEGFYVLADFLVEKRPLWNSGDTERWSVQGWRLGLDSRRLLYKYNDPVKQTFKADYREIPNNRFSDGQSPYLGIGDNTQTLPSSWAVAPGTNDTRGFLTLQQNLVNVKIDTKRRWMNLDYSLKLSDSWNMAIDYSYISKKGEREVGSIFGYTGGNPRGVNLSAPVDYMTNNVDATFNYATPQAQFGLGVYASFFNNDETTLVWQNAFGQQPQWAPGVAFPNSQGQLALEPDNSYWQFKAYGAFNFAHSTRLSADASFGQMKQNDSFLPYTINPILVVNTPVPLASLDGKVDTTMFNVRLTSQLVRALDVAVNYHYDDRNNKSPRAVYPYIGGDSQNQRPYDQGRINLPYSYNKEKADAVFTYRVGGGTHLRAGAEYLNMSRDYSEVTHSDEWAWLAGVKFGGLEFASFNFDYRNSSRDVSDYVGNRPLIESSVPGTETEDDWENQPLLRKYYETDRDREEFRFRADVFPMPEWNLGMAFSYFKDDYAAGYYGLNDAKIKSGTIDVGWHPTNNISLTGFYTHEKYDANQSSISFTNVSQAFDPNRQWWANTTDKVDTWNLALAFSDIGASHGWKNFDVGFDYTYSDTNSVIDVTAATLPTAPLPDLVDKLHTFSAWASLAVSDSSSLRFVIESTKLDSADFAIDNVKTNTLANVLLLGQTGPSYDVLLITGSWTYQF